MTAADASNGLAIQTFRDAEALARGAVPAFLSAVRRAVRERGRFTVALAGGRTPRRFYEHLAGLPASRVPWPAVHAFFGDERPVPPDHADSNYRMAAESLLRRVPLPANQVHRLRGELAPQTAADEYERGLYEFWKLAPPEVPSFDLILLGLGADGHTASLFPETDALGENRRLVCANWVPKFGLHRLTLTLPVLNAARQVVFLVAGADKAQVAKEILEGPATAPRHPAGRVRPPNGELIWLLDAAAASALGRPRSPD